MAKRSESLFIIPLMTRRPVTLTTEMRRFNLLMKIVDALKLRFELREIAVVGEAERIV